MLILSVDTSLPILSVALYSGKLVGAVAMEGKESRNEKLLPAVDWLLAENGIDRSEVRMLAVTRGPGSFTGVRVGLATVQGLGLALNVPIVAMSTHEAAAELWRDGEVVLHNDAGRGEFYGSVFRGDVEVLPPSLLSRGELEEVKGRYRAWADLGELVQQSNLAALAAQRASRLASHQLGERYSDLTPIYVRLAEAEVKLRRV